MKENNKTLTESINKSFLEINTTNKTLVDNSTRKRIISNSNSDSINKEIEKKKEKTQLYYQIYRSQQWSSYYETLIN